MFEGVRNWFARNRTRLAVSAGVIGGIYVAGQYALNKLTEARLRMSEDRNAKEDLRRRFAQNQIDCTYTVLALLPTATDNILNALPVEQITQELQARRTEKLGRSTASSEVAPSDVPSTIDSSLVTSAGAQEQGEGSVTASGYVRASQQLDADGGRGGDNVVSVAAGAERSTPVKSKLQLWDDLKINAITRALTLIYSLALLTLLTRIQLNLLGRRNYLSSVVSLASPAAQTSGISLENRDDDGMDQDYGNDYETNRKYLTFSWWLLHKGWKEVQMKVEAAVREIFGVLAPKDNITFSQLSMLVLEVRKKVEGSTDEDRRMQPWLKYLLPPTEEEDTVLRESGVVDAPPEGAANSSMISASLRRLLDETSDLVDSPSFTHVMTLLLDTSFSLLVDDKVAVQAFKIPPQGQRSGADEGVDLRSTNALFGSTNRVTELADDGVNPLAGQTLCKLATILAVMTRSAHSIGSGGNLDSLMSANAMDITGASPPLRDANEYLAAMEGVRDLEAFAAVVYSSNFEFESIDADIEASTERQNLKESFVNVDTSAQLESAWGRAAAGR